MDAEALHLMIMVLQKRFMYFPVIILYNCIIFQEKNMFCMKNVLTYSRSYVGCMGSANGISN